MEFRGTARQSSGNTENNVVCLCFALLYNLYNIAIGIKWHMKAASSTRRVQSNSTKLIIIVIVVVCIITYTHGGNNT